MYELEKYIKLIIHKNILKYSTTWKQFKTAKPDVGMV